MSKFRYVNAWCPVLPGLLLAMIALFPGNAAGSAPALAMAEIHERPDDTRQKASLASPFGRLPARAISGTTRLRCPATPPPYTSDLDFPSKYEGSGKARDTLNTAAAARYQRATQPLQDFESGLTKLANRYVSGETRAASCALSWLDNWALAGALKGPANMTGQAVRKWTLATAAFSFLQLRDAPGLEPFRLERTRRWLREIAGIVMEEHGNIPAEKMNNHFYWAAAAVGATGIAVSDSTLLEWALNGYRKGVGAIDQDGVLPREMMRNSRALFYHLYALPPLVMLAEMGRVNGQDLYIENDCALCRLVRRSAEGVSDPGFFEKRTRTRQVMDIHSDNHIMAWVAILANACPNDKQLQALSDRYGPFQGRRLGGNLSEIYAHTSKEHSHAIQTQACRHLWR